MSSFWNSLTVDQKLELLKQIVPTISIVIGAIISFLVFYLTKRKEIQFKVHKQRKLKYENYLILYQKVFANVDQIKDGKMPFSQEDWMNMQLGIILYGSDNVISKMVELNKLGRDENNSDNKIILIRLGELMHIMRKEVGLTNKDVSIRDSLSLFITDIHDTKYDNLFK